MVLSVTRASCIVYAGCILAAPCWAAETVTYTYDAQGRVIAVVTTGGVNNGVTQTYQFDPADNRTQANTSGSPNSTPPS